MRASSKHNKNRAAPAQITHSSLSLSPALFFVRLPSASARLFLPHSQTCSAEQRAHAAIFLPFTTSHLFHKTEGIHPNAHAVNSGNQGKMTFGGNAACCFFSTCLKTFLTCLTVQRQKARSMRRMVYRAKKSNKVIKYGAPPACPVCLLFLAAVGGSKMRLNMFCLHFSLLVLVVTLGQENVLFFLLI